MSSYQGGSQVEVCKRMAAKHRDKLIPQCLPHIVSCHSPQPVLGVPSPTKSVVFLNIVQKAVDPSHPLRFEHYGAIFLMDFLKSA